MPTELKGVSQLRSALRKFEPDLAKGMQKEMVIALKPIVKEARGFIPLSSPIRNWRTKEIKGGWPFYNGQLMRRGIGYKTTPTKPNPKGWSYAASINNKTASGAIFETAGRKNEGKGKSARLNFAPQLGVRYGQGAMNGRAIFKAWHFNQGRANGAVMKAIQNAANEFRTKRGTL